MEKMKTAADRLRRVMVGLLIEQSATGWAPPDEVRHLRERRRVGDSLTPIYCIRESSCRRTEGSVEKMMRLKVAPENLDLLNAGRTNSVAKFQEESGGSQYVALDRCPSPGAAVDRNGQWSIALSVEPATGHGVEVLADEADGVR